MQLWSTWRSVLWLLRPGFSRLRTFLWFATAVAGFTVRTDLLGVTSIVRALQLKERFYTVLLESFHSSAVKLDRLTALWTQIVLRLFPGVLRVNGRLVLVGDGIKTAKRGRKMPAVKLLHQQSDSKPQYTMGHSLQVVSVLVQAASSVFAVPLAMRIHEGLVWSNRDRRTLLDKMLLLLGALAIPSPYYFVADAYYAAGKIVTAMLRNGHHLISRARSNATAYAAASRSGPRRRGRPRLYGKKIKLKTLFKDTAAFQEAPSPVYGEKKVSIRYRVCDLMWRPARRQVRFVLVAHPIRGCLILMCTDISLDGIEIIRLYGLRFKIEHSFKQAKHVIGSFSYHFWMADMKPLRWRNGNQHLHRETLEYRERIKRKMHAYHTFLQAGVVCQGLLQYLSATLPDLVWNSFGSWLRTVRTGIPPSEWVVASALRQSLPQFLLTAAQKNPLMKFILDRQGSKERETYRMAS
jgi:DDE superfamily endonuclease